MRKMIIFIIGLTLSISASGQHINGNYPDRKIVFPDIPGYLTIVSGLHMHTVLSEGYVWPNIRVDEAVRDGIVLCKILK